MNLTQARLKELLDYDPETGVFTWRTSRGSRATAGQQTSRTPGTAGYLRIRVDGALYSTHRLAFLWMVGAWPTAQIDHINGNKVDNRWCNLREATQGENKQNLGGPKRTNTVGLLGVSRSRNGCNYRARIQINGVQHNLGEFKTPEQAHAAYLVAKKELHTHNERALSNDHS